MKKRSGLFEPPLIMVHEIHTWLESCLAQDLVSDLLGNEKDLQDWKKERIKKLEKFYLSSVKSKAYGNRNYEKTFSTKINGWKYEKKFSQEKWKEVLSRRPSVSVSLTAFEHRENHKDSITGGWIEKRNLIRLAYTRGESGLQKEDRAFWGWFKKFSQKLFLVIRHELQHLGQVILQDVLGQERSTKDEDIRKALAGLPSKAIATPEFLQHFSQLTIPQREDLLKKFKRLATLMQGRSFWDENRDLEVIFHSLDDVEFYSKLTDEVQKFGESFEGLDFSSEDIKNWIQESKFFKMIKGDKGKFQKGVKEFFKAIH